MSAGTPLCTLFAALRTHNGADHWRDGAAAEADDAVASTAASVRGTYTVTGFRADADLLLWLVGPSVDVVQDGLLAFRRTRLGHGTHLSWSAIGVHRGAEVQGQPEPAFVNGTPPAAYVCVYSMARSTEWYLISASERRERFVQYGALAGDHRRLVSPNTTSAFALGDSEWLLAFEADELTTLVDLARGMRAAEGRRHVRREAPIFTGRRRPFAEAVAALP